jgi:hypothetical protein
MTKRKEPQQIITKPSSHQAMTKGQWDQIQNSQNRPVTDNSAGPSIRKSATANRATTGRSSLIDKYITAK